MKKKDRNFVSEPESVRELEAILADLRGELVEEMTVTKPSLRRELLDRLVKFN